MGAINKLTATQVKGLTERGLYGDGRGLWLRISEFGTKSWVFRYMVAGKARNMGLGPVSLQKHDGGVTLAEAREARDRCHRLLREGTDPIDARQEKRLAVRAAAAMVITFKEAAEKYIAAHKAGWRNAKHAEQWTSTLASYAFPVIGSLSVASVGTAHVMKVLEPIWAEKTETASRVRGRIEAILDWARARGYRDGDNPARWRGHLDKLLPARRAVQRTRKQPAMPHAELPEFMGELRGMNSISARALEFTILTAARTGEAIGATWAEFDLDGKAWTIPAKRMKGHREHRVPLSDRAVEILNALPREPDNEHVFIGARKGRGLSNMAMLELLRGVRDALTVHGFRSTFRDWAAERTSYQNHVVEMALAHAIGDKVEAAYRRGDLYEKRARLMRDWSKYCETAAIGADNVVPMQAGAAS